MLANNDVPFTSLVDIPASIKAGAISSAAGTETMLARIASVDPDLHSYLVVTAGDARRQAAQADAEIVAGRHRGPLHGVPIAIKDLFFTAGAPATFGSMAYKEFAADYTATIVERLLAAGAVILGRLHLHEGALAPHHPGFGEAPTHPYVKGYWPGGSSSGSGTASIFTGAGFDASRERRQASAPAPSASAANGTIGMPGISASTPAAAETMPRAIGFIASWATRALSALPSTPAFDTRKPAAIEITRAGIWLTRPPPMVRTV